MSTKKIVLTGGGTAGHVMPNLALLPLLNAFDEIHYIGSVGGIEENILKAFPQVIYHSINCTKLKRSLTPKNLAVPFKLIKSVRDAKRILQKIQPTVIFSKGGFVSLPVCLAAKGVCPVVLHESDQSLGLANRLSAKHCDKILTSFKLSDKHTVHTGAPLRQELYRGNKHRAKVKYAVTGSLPCLLVTGGSLGARAINDAVENALPQLTRHFFVIHICGKNNHKDLTHDNYRRLDFSDDMPDLYALADFVVCRGGANTLFEVTALAKPALVIPLSKKVSRGDQIQNAEYFEDIGSCRVIQEENLNASSLVSELKLLCKNADFYKNSAKQATAIDGTAKIAGILSQYAE